MNIIAKTVAIGDALLIVEDSGQYSVKRYSDETNFTADYFVSETAADSLEHACAITARLTAEQLSCFVLHETRTASDILSKAAL